MEQYQGTGRRKTAVARVYLRPGSGKVNVGPLERAALKQGGPVNMRACLRQAGSTTAQRLT